MKTLPVLPIKNTVILPGNSIPLRIGRAQSIAAVEKAQAAGGFLVALAQREIAGDASEHPKINAGTDLYTIGTYAKIEKIRGDAESGYHIVLRGISRYRVGEFSERDGAIFAEAEEWKDTDDFDKATSKALLTSIQQLSAEILELVPADTRQIAEVISGVDKVCS